MRIDQHDNSDAMILDTIMANNHGYGGRRMFGFCFCPRLAPKITEHKTRCGPERGKCERWLLASFAAGLIVGCPIIVKIVGRVSRVVRCPCSEPRPSLLLRLSVLGLPLGLRLKGRRATKLVYGQSHTSSIILSRSCGSF